MLWSETPAPEVEVADAFCLSGHDTSSQEPSDFVTPVSTPRPSARPAFIPQTRTTPLGWDVLVNGWVLICEQGKALTRG